jgi:hypothetical protein
MGDGPSFFQMAEFEQLAVFWWVMICQGHKVIGHAKALSEILFDDTERNYN